MTSARAARPIRFASEADERAFWETHDTADYVDWSKAMPAAFPNLKPSTTTVSVDLPARLLESLEREASRLDVPLDVLIKTWLAERIDARGNA